MNEMRHSGKMTDPHAHRASAAFRITLVLLMIAMAMTASAGSAHTRLPEAATGCGVWVAIDGDDEGAGTSNEPWATIQHAIDAVPIDGCLVTVGPGVHSGRVHITRRFTSRLTLKSAVDYRAVLEHSSTVVDLDGARNVVIEGFEIKHSGPSAKGFLVSVDRGENNVWSQSVTLRNNILHDSYDNDLVKIHAGVRYAVVEGNILFNQGESEQHIDVNSVTDVVIQDNIFFNDFDRSQRSFGMTKHFIVIKDSGRADDGLVGSRNITVRRNVFMNWEGGREALVRVGNDGKPYFEAREVQIESNLFLANSGLMFDTPVGVSGAQNVTFVNNTVVGDLAVGAYGFRAQAKGSNPKNESVTFANNIWSDPSGTMSRFNSGEMVDNIDLEVDNNLFWNGGEPIPGGQFLDPAEDRRRKVADPGLSPNGGADVPTWNGSSFASGSGSIRQEFLRLVRDYATVGSDSAAVDAANESCAAATDITGRQRGPRPDIGAWEVRDTEITDDDSGMSEIASYPILELAFGCRSNLEEHPHIGDSIVHCHLGLTGTYRRLGLTQCVL